MKSKIYSFEIFSHISHTLINVNENFDLISTEFAITQTYDTVLTSIATAKGNQWRSKRAIKMGDEAI
jgi:hypothetical protein